MPTAHDLVARRFGTSQGELLIGGIAIRNIVERHGTPVYVYDAAILEEKLELLRRALPPFFSICYSVKANPNPAILKLFLERGCGLEVASAGEFCQALSAGSNPKDIVFAGPGKTDAELEIVLKQGIGEIHAESLLEVQRIEKIATRFELRARVALRINPTEDAQGGAMRMGGKPLPFGVDEEALDPVLQELLAAPHIDFRGIHLFAGTQILNADVLVLQYRKGLEIASRVADRLGSPLSTVDFGGGLGVPYFAHEKELDVDRLREGLRTLFEEYGTDKRFAGTRFMVEPGRYLVAESGVYVARVIDIKVSRGKKFLILDGGMNHHLAASGNLGQTIKRNYPVALLNSLDLPVGESVEVVGPLCTPLDVLARGVLLPRPEVGDLFGVFQSGAYARGASPLNFLSHPTPPEVLIENGKDRLIRRRGNSEDYLRDLPIPARSQE